MRARKSFRAPIALAALALAALAYAGAQARLTGKVTDMAGNAMEGVSITITTPALGTYKVNLKTDKRGQYGTILNDATRPYHLKFEKEGYLPVEFDKKVPVGDIGVVDVKLAKPAEVAPAAAAPSVSDLAVLAFNAGVDLLQAGDKASAEAKFQEAVEKNPDLTAGWQALATLAHERQEWAKTLEYGQKALDLDPTMTSLYGLLADAAQKSGDKKAASDWQAKYAEANPDTPEVLYNKGIDAYNKGKIKDAEASLAKAVEVKPDFALAHFWLGMVSFNLNKKPAAKEHLGRYLELEPSGSEAGTAKEILSVLK